MPTFVKSHDANLCVVCILCLHKGSESLTSTWNKLFKMHILPDYDNHEQVLLQVHSDTCMLALSSLDTAEPEKLPPQLNYASLVQELRNLAPRSNDNCISSVRWKARETLPSLGAIPNVVGVNTTVNICNERNNLNHKCSFTHFKCSLF